MEADNDHATMRGSLSSVSLGKDGSTKSDESLEKFQNEGVGVIFNPKIYVADFGKFKQGFLSMKFLQNSNFRVQGMFFQQLY